jgi:hypothetical protein
VLSRLSTDRTDSEDKQKIGEVCEICKENLVAAGGSDIDKLYKVKLNWVFSGILLLVFSLLVKALHESIATFGGFLLLMPLSLAGIAFLYRGRIGRQYLENSVSASEKLLFKPLVTYGLTTTKVFIRRLR